MREIMSIDHLRALYGQLPAGFRHALLARRRAPIWRRAGIIFVHIPKAAGTSINQALYGRFMGHITARTIKRWSPRAVQQLPTFCVTRNPWDRLVSAYRFATRGSGIDGPIVAGMNNATLYQSPEFATFERFVNEWLVGQDVMKLDGVFKPQWTFFCDENKNPIVDHVGKVEEMPFTLNYIKEKIGKSISLVKTNTSGEKIIYRSLYNPRLAYLVGEIYKNDIELMRYDF